MTAEPTPLATARRSVAERWDCPADGLMAQDFSASFPWANRHHIVVVSEPGKRSLVAAVPSSGAALVFDDPQSAGALNRFFEGENIALPDGLPAEHLADAVRSFLLGVRGIIGSPAFLEKERGRLRLWLARPEDETMLREHCAPPELRESADGWELRFDCFNAEGGVERWRVKGRVNAVDSVHHEMARANGTFRFPYV